MKYGLDDIIQDITKGRKVIVYSYQVYDVEMLLQDHNIGYTKEPIENNEFTEFSPIKKSRNLLTYIFG